MSRFSCTEFTSDLRKAVQCQVMVYDVNNGGVSVDCVVSTPEGLAPVGWLGVGDLIETLDAGFQPVVRVDQLTGDHARVDLGGGISTDQRVLAAGWPVEMYFGYDEMLAQAGDLVDAADGSGDFVQIVMEKPALLRIGDIWIESHGAARSSRPVLRANEVDLIKRAFGCPLVRCSEVVGSGRPHVSTTFGSQAAVA